MRHNSFRWVTIPMLFLIACQGSYNKEAAEPKQVTSLQSASRSRIKTADIECRVADVTKATPELERTVDALGGVVEESTIKAETIDQHTRQLSTDSLQLMKRYAPVANMTLRIPVEYIDSVLSVAASMASFIDHRIISNKDITLELERNNLLNDVPDRSTNDAEIKAERKISNLRMLEHAVFSTITVRLTQPETLDIQTLANPTSLSNIGFAVAFNNAFHWGAEAMLNVLVFFTHLWPLLILLTAALLFLRKIKRARVQP